MAANAPKNPLFAVAEEPLEKEKEARIQLKNMDSVAAKTLDPWGVSIIDDIPLESLWNTANAHS